MNKNTLYITFDGLSDPLGQSQILPYLCGLARRGFHITILSCEKKDRLEKEKPTIDSLIGNLPVTWKYILYNSDGGMLSRFAYIVRIRRLATTACRNKKISLVHCRSYLASLIGLFLKLRYKIPFVFDMRGFWADERLDGGIWKKSNPLQGFFYAYFKKKEKEFILRSDAVVSLTNAAVNELCKQYSRELITGKTHVIPCCVNTVLFNSETTEKAKTLPVIKADDHLLIYTGSIGTWYYTSEMIDCVLAWKEFIPAIKLLILTKDTEELEKILLRYTPEQRLHIITASSSHKEVAGYLALAKAAIFFIKPSFSKIASSPTKMAECWSMGLPIITNAGIGDNDLYFNTHKGGILISDFLLSEYHLACRKYLSLSHQPEHYRNIALRYFDTDMGIEKYNTIYEKLSS